MLKILYPDMYVNSLMEIPLEKLEILGKKAFILDLDNTVTEWNSNNIKEEIAEWFSLIKREGFKACILSNNREERVVAVAENLGIPYIHRAQKPRKGAFFRAADLMGVSGKQTVVIGDQVFTDVLGGNRAGLFTILVVPIAKREFLGTKISRIMEKLVLRRIKKYLQQELDK